MKKTIILLAMLAAAASYAEFVEKPDANTLWCEDGRDIQCLDKSVHGKWNNSGFTLDPLPEGGFLAARRDPKFNAFGRYVPLDPNYRFFEMEVLSFEPESGYRAFGVPGINGVHTFEQVANPRPGIIVFDIFENAPIQPQVQAQFMQMRFHGLKAAIRYVKMVRAPANSIRVESKAFADKKEFTVGDTLTFTVNLAENAEDVSLRLYSYYTMPLLKVNGMDKIQLKPVDGNEKTWSATVKIDSFHGKEIRAGGVLVCATVLGGGINVPLWSMISYKYTPPQP